MQTIRFAVLLLFTAGCGPAEPCPYEPQFYTALGIGIYAVEDAAEWTTYDDLSTRVDAMAQIVATYAGRPVTDLRGWIIVFRNVKLFQCAGKQAVGCEHPEG
jgi:hypothetical protein